MNTDTPNPASTASPHSSRHGAKGVLEVLPRGSVSLLPSHWRDQYDAARSYYVDTLREDDILHGFRRAVGLDAPGNPLTGWCRDDSRVVFGQWISGLAMFAADGDERAEAKVRRLVAGWAQVFERDPALIVQHYPFDKLVGGLVDVATHVDRELALPLLEQLVDVAISTLSRRNVPAAAWPPELADGDELEWYTLTENLLRAFTLTGDDRLRDFARAWEYTEFWDRFLDGSDPAGLEGRHAYSHLNAINGAAMSYAVGGDERYLRIAANAHDWFRATQCYATGGFGPSERTLRADGSLGRALDFRADCFESPCGSWAAFKLGRALLTATGDARFADWTERLVYNGVGAALGISEGGYHTYYADYRVSSGLKTPYHDTYACCSGSYSQAVSDYPNLVFMRTADTLHVNLYLPAAADVELASGRLAVRMDTSFPDDGRVRIRVAADDGMSVDATIALRVPAWSEALTVTIDGEPMPAVADELGWIRLRRAWPSSGATVTVDFALGFRAEPVDVQHPDRIAFMRGPVVMVVESSHHEPFPWLPRELDGHVTRDPDSPERWLLPDVDGRRFRARVKPFYSAKAFEPYRMYIDLPELPQELW
jgi:hypothetical protein